MGQGQPLRFFIWLPNHGNWYMDQKFLHSIKFGGCEHGNRYLVGGENFKENDRLLEKAEEHEEPLHPTCWIYNDAVND